MMKFKQYQIFLCCIFLSIAAQSAWSEQLCRSISEIPASAYLGRFIDHADGTVTDTHTGLMWSKCILGYKGDNCSEGSDLWSTWQTAVEESRKSNLGGYSNWRLPNLNELLSIVEERCYNPAIDSSVFPNTPPRLFWTSTPDPDNEGYAKYVNFWGGTAYQESRSSRSSASVPFRIRIVRNLR